MAKISKSDKTKPKVTRKRVSQTDIPAHSLNEALRIATAIEENYGAEPTKPINVAAAMELSPQSSLFKMLAGASIAYGLTEGGYNAAEIPLTELGKRIVRPTAEGDDQVAKVVAFLKPRIIQEFTQKYDGSPIPKDKIAANVLSEMGVPRERGIDVLASIIEGAKSLGLVSEIKGKFYLNLASQSQGVRVEADMDTAYSPTEDVEATSSIKSENSDARELVVNTSVPVIDDGRTKRVFVTHGKNQDFIAPIKKLLSFGELEPVVSVENQSVSKPVPEKVMDDMRKCGAAIIHVDLLPFESASLG